MEKAYWSRIHKASPWSVGWNDV